MGGPQLPPVLGMTSPNWLAARASPDVPVPSDPCGTKVADDTYIRGLSSPMASPSSAPTPPSTTIVRRWRRSTLPSAKRDTGESAGVGSGLGAGNVIACAVGLV